MIFSSTGRIFCNLPLVCMLPLVCGPQTACYTYTSQVESKVCKGTSYSNFRGKLDICMAIWHGLNNLHVCSINKIGRAHKGFGQSHGRDKFSCTFLNRNLPKVDTLQFKQTLTCKHGLNHIQTLLFQSPTTRHL